MIPKLVHQIGPANRENWHYAWFECQKSIQTNIKFEYVFWNDGDMIDNFIQIYYPNYVELYRSFPFHIMRIDFAKYCILKFYGGIYADLDIYCFKNFHHLLTNDFYIVENALGPDPIENSIIASVNNHKFYDICFDLIIERNEQIKQMNIDFNAGMFTNDDGRCVNLRNFVVLYVTGTNMITEAYKRHKVELLDGVLFNNLPNSYSPTFYTKHLHTNLWGDEDRNDVNTVIKDNFNFSDKSIEFYKQLRSINLRNFDYYTDYTQGNYLQAIDFSNNMEKLNNNVSYTFLKMDYS